MEHASRETVAELKARGYRITGARKHIIEAMEKATQPKSIRDLANSVDADEASVYRTIDLLLEEELVEAIPLQDESFVYALKTEHHHHLVCVTCNRVTHIECKDEGRVRLRPAGFAKILRHEVTYYGLCKSCC